MVYLTMLLLLLANYLVGDDSKMNIRQNYKFQRMIRSKLKRLGDDDRTSTICVALLAIQEQSNIFEEFIMHMPDNPDDDNLLDCLLELQSGVDHIQYHLDEVRAAIKLLLKDDRFR